MTKQKIYFRADASQSIGYGHFIRTLALADMLKDHFDCTFFTVSPTPYQQAEMQKVCHWLALDQPNALDHFITLLQGDEIVVLDNYFYTTEYQQLIKDKGCKLVCIDDMHNKHYVADLVVNHAINDVELFDVEPYTHLAIGYQWALLRKPFFSGKLKPKPTKINKVAICFGGSDYLNLTKSSIEKLLTQRDDIFITAIVGDKYNVEDKVLNEKVVYKQNLSAQQVADVFTEADLAVVSTSGVCLEALACGSIVASGTYVDNQEAIYKDYVSNKLIYPLGDMRACKAENLLLDEIENNISSLERLESIKSTPANFVRLFKTQFVLSDISEMGYNYLNYSELGGGKSRLVHQLRNHPEVRRWMEHQDVIPLENHLRFVESLKNKTNKTYWAVFENELLVGSVNIEWTDNDTVERGIYINPECFGKSVGTKIEEGLIDILNQLHVRHVIAKVLISNPRSLKFHIKNGYEQYDKDIKYIYLIRHLV